MKQLIGQKIGMTQVYTEDNRLVPVTVIELGPCVVTQVKTAERDGYDALQIGFGSAKEKNTAKPQLGHYQKVNIAAPRHVREVRLKGAAEVEAGTTLTVEQFSDEAKVDVIGTSKGRGFQGVVKRWNFAGGPASHGAMFHRRGGSYGMCQWPGRVIKGKKMPGHYGVDRKTIQNLKVVKVVPEKHLLLVQGSVPGHAGAVVVVRETIKKRRKVA